MSTNVLKISVTEDSLTWWLPYSPFQSVTLSTTSFSLTEITYRTLRGPALRRAGRNLRYNWNGDDPREWRETKVRNRICFSYKHSSRRKLSLKVRVMSLPSTTTLRRRCCVSHQLDLRAEENALASSRCTSAYYCVTVFMACMNKLAE